MSGPSTEGFTCEQALISGIRMSYETSGTGNPLLMIHGFGANLCTWRAVAPRLAETRRVILLDLKGSGQSDKPVAQDYGPQDHARLVVDLIRSLGLTELTLVGHSMGGGVALLTALLLSEAGDPRLKRLILVNTIAYPQKLPAFVAILRVPFLGRVSMRLIPASVMTRLVLREAYFRPDRISADTVECYARPLRDRQAKRALVTTATRIIPPDFASLQSRYAQILTPTLIIWGDHDRIVPLSNGQRLAREIPSARFKVIGDCGHIPPEEQPEAFLSLLQDFMAEPA